MYKGIAASPGIAVGPAVVLKGRDDLGSFGPERLTPEMSLNELHAARTTALNELAQLQKKTEAEIGAEEAKIFEAQRLILTDPSFFGEIEKLVKKGLSAPKAIRKLVAKWKSTIAELDNDYIRQRATDIEDVGDLLLRHLEGKTEELVLNEPSVVLARTLTPSLVAQLPKANLLAVATEKGGANSHVAIMARALGIPAIVGIEPFLKDVNEGDTVVIDGTKGILVVRPSAEECERWRSEQERLRERWARVRAGSTLPARTLDGVRIRIAANISQPEATRELRNLGAEGVGLFRTEFLYMGRDAPPSEQEQFEVYRHVLEAVDPEPVVIRTIDIGGDKDVPYLGIGKEDNPFLGFRALRYCLSHQEIFRLQLRALLRASVYGKLRIMFPMVTNLTELQMADACLEEARQELVREGSPISDDIKIGIMVETPAAAIMSDVLAEKVDFFSLGTNDLTQYTLAVDRHNEKVAPLYDSFDPAVIRLIQRTVSSARAAGIWVGLCGEMASDLLAVPLLVGVGLNELSMNATAIPWVKEKVRRFTMPEAEDIAKKAQQLRTGTEVRQFLATVMERLGS